MPRTDSLEKQIADHARKPVQKRKAADTTPMVSSGSTTLNLGCSDRASTAFMLGGIINIIGDSHAGKTLLALTMLAEAASNKDLSNYKLYYDDAERALHFNVKKMFGQVAAERIGCDKRNRSRTLLDFRGRLDDLIKAGKPFIYVLDSLDSLTTEDEITKADKILEAQRKGTKITGTMGMSKAKGMSEMLRLINEGVEGTGSLVVIISQTRQNINPMSFVPKTRAGGDALEFYALHVMWLARVKKLTGTINKRKIVTGSKVRVRITKNKITGKVRECEFNTYPDYGVDDIESCIVFLEEHGKINEFKKAHDIKYKETTAIIRAIEDRNLEGKLRRAAGWLWKELEDAAAPKRKAKYK